MKQELLVIKIGGQVVNNPMLLDKLIKVIAATEQLVVLVHGGGNKATSLCKDLNIETKFISGRRVTDSATLEVVIMVYAGLINKQIVAKLQAEHTNAIGVCGADLNLLPAIKRPLVDGIDYGWVGDIHPEFNIIAWKKLLAQNAIPVVAPITHDSNGQLLNTNADTIASNIAIGLATTYDVRLIYLFEKPGVLQDANDETSVITNITPSILPQLIRDRIIADGMIPKLQNAVHAVHAGLKAVSIGHALDIEAIINRTAGTCIQND